MSASAPGLGASLAKALPSLRQSVSPVDRITYSRDLWPRHHLAVSDGRIAEHKPGVIVWPESADEVAELVRYCAGEGAALVPFGAGSGVCAGILPNPRVVVCDLKRMKRWSILDGGELLDVEAGAMGITLEDDLEARGYTLGHFPSSILCSTVGGWVAARSAGQCSGLYGKIEDMVASLSVVTGAGDKVELERRVHGPDLTPLLIGSEGILGVVTSARLRLHRAPEHRAFGAWSFPSVEAGYTAMRRIFQGGLRPAVSRLYDPFDSFLARRGSVKEHSAVRAPKSAHRIGAGALALRSVLRVPGALNGLVDALGTRVFGGAMLVLVFEGAEADNPADLARAAAIARALGAEDLGEAPARHWFKHRYAVSYRQAPVFMAGAFSDTMEVAASWSRLGDLYKNVRAALGPHVFVMAHLSHAYPDGCSIYFTFAGSAPTVALAEEKYDAAWRAALGAAIESGGTLSHHHGVGRSKAPRLGAELGLGVEMVRALGRAMDPAGIMNPGNLLPREPSTTRRALSAPPTRPALDPLSGLVHVSGAATLGEVESFLAREGLSLSLGSDAPSLAETTVDAWIAAGARGAPDPWSDPVDHLVAGFSAVLRSGGELEIRPAPRRAVGPDLFAMFLGMRGRVGRIVSAHLRAHGAERARPMPSTFEHNPPVNEAESRLIERVVELTAQVG
jgi:alkyldihydroxyacetonephosphate synthase